MPQKINAKQGGEWVEIAKLTYTGLTSTPVNLNVPTGYKFMRIVSKVVQQSAVASEAALRMRFNNNTASNYPRRFTRWTDAGVANANNSTEATIIAGLTAAANAESQVILEGVGDGSDGWALFQWNLVGTPGGWSYGFGNIQYMSNLPITSIQIYQDTHTVNGTLIVYGHN